jgi:glutamate/tyrosine decarboxylase-like PLP-dependent enzyme
MPGLDTPPEVARALAERVVDLWVEHSEGLAGAAPVEPRPEDRARESIADVPAAPLAPAELLREIELLFGSATQIPHARFFGYMPGGGTAAATVAELVCAALNQNLVQSAASPVATQVECRVLRWFADRVGLPPGAGGIFVTGGELGIVAALKAARDRADGGLARRRGLGAARLRTVYGSVLVHEAVDRACDTLGLGSDALRRLPVDGDDRLDVAALADAVARDRRSGCEPIAVVASAGAAATGSIDPLADIADLCAREGLWLHVDGCYGGAAALAPELRPLLRGIERADSIGIDAHKWLSVPYTAAILLVRDPGALARAFSTAPDYMRSHLSGRDQIVDFFQFAPHFSRPFLGLKLWLSLLAHGGDAYAGRIAHDVQLARYLAARIGTARGLELRRDPELSIVCFRYLPSRELSDAASNELNHAVMATVQRGGDAHCSSAVLDGKVWLRACVANFRTEAEDVDALVEAVLTAGRELAA